MKYAYAAAALISLAALPALADNPDVDGALKNHPELSDFTQALERTGVLQSLDSSRSYTIFAPTNAAMEEITQTKYPCFYMPQCQAEATQLLQNHIVPGFMHISETAAQQGGFYPLSNRFVTVGKFGVNDYAVGGHYVMAAFRQGDALVYEIDGLIANPYERATMEYSDVYVPQEQVTTSSTTIPDPACRDNSCSDSSTRTITYTRSVIVH